MAELRQVFEFTGDEEPIGARVDWESVEEHVNNTSGDAINKRCKEIIAATVETVFDENTGLDDVIEIFARPVGENVTKIAALIHKMLGVIYFQLFKGASTFQPMTYVINQDSDDSVPGEPIMFADEDPLIGAPIKCIINAGSILAALKVEANNDTEFDSQDQRIARAVLKNTIDDKALGGPQLLPIIIIRLICEHAMIHLIQMINGGVVAATQSIFNHNPATTFLGHSRLADLNEMLSSQISFTLAHEERRALQLLHVLNK